MPVRVQTPAAFITHSLARTNMLLEPGRGRLIEAPHHLRPVDLRPQPRPQQVPCAAYDRTRSVLPRHVGRRKELLETRAEGRTEEGTPRAAEHGKFLLRHDDWHSDQPFTNHMPARACVCVCLRSPMLAKLLCCTRQTIPLSLPAIAGIFPPAASPTTALPTPPLPKRAAIPIRRARALSRDLIKAPDRVCRSSL
jgi:hypothetical protein